MGYQKRRIRQTTDDFVANSNILLHDASCWPSRISHITNFTCTSFVLMASSDVEVSVAGGARLKANRDHRGQKYHTLQREITESYIQYRSNH